MGFYIAKRRYTYSLQFECIEDNWHLEENWLIEENLYLG